MVALHCNKCDTPGTYPRDDVALLGALPVCSNQTPVAPEQHCQQQYAGPCKDSRPNQDLMKRIPDAHHHKHIGYASSSCDPNKSARPMHRDQLGKKDCNNHSQQRNTGIGEGEPWALIGNAISQDADFTQVTFLPWCN